MMRKMRTRPLERCRKWAIRRMHQHVRMGFRNLNTVYFYWRADAAKRANEMWHLRVVHNGYRAIKGGERVE